MVESEERAVEPVYAALLTRLHHCARANPTLKTEIAIYAAIDVAVDLSIAFGLLWSKRPDIVATLRILADGLEQHQQINQPRRSSSATACGPESARHTAGNRLAVTQHHVRRRPPVRQHR